MYAIKILCDADACRLAGNIREEWTVEQVITAFSLFGGGANE